MEQLPLGPRERDRRWRHRIGDGSEFEASPAPATGSAVGIAAPAVVAPAPDDLLLDLLARVEALEQQVRDLRAERRGLP